MHDLLDTYVNKKIQIKAKRIAEMVVRSWGPEKMPPVGKAIIHELPDSPPIEAYFANRPIEKVNLDDPKIWGENPFLWGLTSLGIRYYISSYLLRCLDLPQHRRFIAGQELSDAALDFPCMNLIYYLCERRYG